ncbi:DNA helicase RecQ [Clostridium sp. chh4-2]|uniref:DNA helicase RecQ n=1 Tax=Clostridium sp. chh4-2 TaxID=2067550 RepID=UPI000CCDB053|nr:DNA helicase RecQ [Clostridium sp. chh4-2]PNV62097.1 DNA helicase RecQ [Clostridium sp. chh4-2]
MTQYEILKQYFGYDEFRDGQELLINSILDGNDVMGIMPTGSGKSLCFQIPALMMDGVTLVISPLISLMKDQVATLNQVGIHAAFLNSSLTAGQYYKALEYAREGRYPIIYVAPERLETDAFLDFALHTKISMVAVDEAHCVSQWGQDFRSSYLKIVEFIKKLPKRPVVSAFTATATKEVREDIIDILMLREPTVVTTGYDRPNLFLGVQAPKDKYAALKNFVETHPDQCGIVYCLTRKLVEEVSDRLREDGISVTRYHAGLSDKERRQNQDDFIYDRYQVMVATNAFGMGIDKSNVRFVIHYNMPKSIEAFYQEIGRCARDQEPGECILFYSGQDVVTNQFFIDNNTDNQELDPVTRQIVAERDRDRLRKMTFYCFTNECLRDYILRYFGEYGSNYCGNCVNCLSQFETVDVTDIAKALIGCAFSSHQRYGVNVIVDTVHGANTAKIRQYRMDGNPYYGALAKVPVFKLRQVINYLMLQDFLTVTNDEYAIVKLTANSGRILEEGEPVVMKMAKEQEHVAKEKSEKKPKKSKMAGVDLSAADEEVFDKLRALRSEIAKEEKVPPYIVFSDKTLVHMSMVKPRTKADMLSVSGVGEFKFEKYGERFLKCIEEAAPPQVRAEEHAYGSADGGMQANAMGYDIGEDDLYFVSDSGEFDDWSIDDAMAAWENGSTEPVKQAEPTVEAAAVKKKKSKATKTDFVMTEELAEQLHYSDRVSISDFVGQINDMRDEEVMKRLTIKSVEQKLMDEGYFEERFINGLRRRKLTETGEAFGIIVEKRLSEKGNEYDVFFYDEKAQRGIVKWLLESE